MLSGILTNHEDSRRSVQPSPVKNWPPLYAEVLHGVYRPCPDSLQPSVAKGSWL